MLLVASSDALVTSSEALVTSRDALVTKATSSNPLVISSDALVTSKDATSSYLLLVVIPVLLARTLLVAICYQKWCP